MLFRSCHEKIRKQNKRRWFALGVHFVLSLSSAILLPIVPAVICILILLLVSQAYNFYVSKVISKIIMDDLIECGSEAEEIGDEKWLVHP